MTVQDGKLTSATCGRPTTSRSRRARSRCPPSSRPLGVHEADAGLAQPRDHAALRRRSPRSAPQMWKTLTGEQVDGVLAIDPRDARRHHRGRGADQRRRAWSSTPTTSSTTSSTTSTSRAPAIPNQIARRDRLSEIAQTAIDTLDQRDWKPAHAAQAAERRGRRAPLPGVVDRSRSSSAAWVGAGMAGVLIERLAARVASLNFGGNKLDQFLAVNGDLVGREDRRAGPTSPSSCTSRTTRRSATSFYIVGPVPRHGQRRGRVPVAGDVRHAGDRPPDRHSRGRPRSTSPARTGRPRSSRPPRSTSSGARPRTSRSTSTSRRATNAARRSSPRPGSRRSTGTSRARQWTTRPAGVSPGEAPVVRLPAGPGTGRGPTSGAPSPPRGGAWSGVVNRSEKFAIGLPPLPLQVLGCGGSGGSRPWIRGVDTALLSVAECDH